MRSHMTVLRRNLLLGDAYLWSHLLFKGGRVILDPNCHNTRKTESSSIGYAASRPSEI